MTAEAGVIERWRFLTASEIRNTSIMDHPFHLHVWPFLVADGPSGPGWKDTINVPVGEPVRIHVPFANISGRTVHHCHIRDHEDLGNDGSCRRVQLMLPTDGLRVVASAGRPSGPKALPPTPIWVLIGKRTRHSRWRKTMSTSTRHDRTAAATKRPPRSDTQPRRNDRPGKLRSDHIWAALRISLGWTFLWAFLDKTFGLGAATESEDAWVDGGSPTEGFLSFGTRGPLKDLFDWMAGDMWADWLFMIGLAAIGIALILGIGMRVAAASGAILLVLMWAAALWPENNPFIDDHLVYAIALIGLALVHAGDTWGLGNWWSRRPIVKNNPVLR